MSEYTMNWNVSAAFVVPLLYIYVLSPERGEVLVASGQCWPFQSHPWPGLVLQPKLHGQHTHGTVDLHLQGLVPPPMAPFSKCLNGTQPLTGFTVSTPLLPLLPLHPIPSFSPTMTAVCSDPGVWTALDSPLRPAAEDAPLPDLSPPPGVVAWPVEWVEWPIPLRDTANTQRHSNEKNQEEWEVKCKCNCIYSTWAVNGPFASVMQYIVTSKGVNSRKPCIQTEIGVYIQRWQPSWTCMHAQ